MAPADRGLRRLVWNDAERRPRAPARTALATVALVFAGVAGVLVGNGLTGLAASLGAPALRAVVATPALTAPTVGFVAGILLSARFVDRRTLRDLGLERSRAWWADLGFGLVLGAALPAFVFAVELAAGFVAVTDLVRFRTGSSIPVGSGVPAWLALALVFAYFVAVGLFEELLFRGYLLVNVAEGLDGWRGIGTDAAVGGAAAVTSVLFGLAHGSNPNATPLALANIVCYGGLFAATVLLTGRIAAAVGLHVAWNFSFASLFGFPVSGFTTPVTVLAVRQSGPPLLTGGAFGPEGGALVLLALLVGAGALAAWVRWREGGLRWDRSVARPTLRSAADGESEDGDEGGRVPADVDAADQRAE